MYNKRIKYNEVLTPNHFLIGQMTTAPTCMVAENMNSRLKNHWKAGQKLTDIFWKRWIQKYLPTLAKMTKWYKEKKQVVCGGIVLIIHPNGPRNL